MSHKADEVVNRWDVWMRKCGEQLHGLRPDLYSCGCWFDMRDPAHPYHPHFSEPESGPIVCASCFQKNMYNWPANVRQS